MERKTVTKVSYVNNSPLTLRVQREYPRHIFRWLNKQQSILIIDHESTSINLSDVLDVYIQAVVEGDDWEDAIGSVLS